MITFHRAGKVKTVPKTILQFYHDSYCPLKCPWMSPNRGHFQNTQYKKFLYHCNCWLKITLNIWNRSEPSGGQQGICFQRSVRNLFQGIKWPCYALAKYLVNLLYRIYERQNIYIMKLWLWLKKFLEESKTNCILWTTLNKVLWGVDEVREKSAYKKIYFSFFP